MRIEEYTKPIEAECENAYYANRTAGVVRVLLRHIAYLVERVEYLEQHPGPVVYRALADVQTALEQHPGPVLYRALADVQTALEEHT